METKLENYVLVQSESKEDLERDVLNKIRGGWTPIGGVTIIKHSFVHAEQILWFYQAMVK